MCVFQRACCMKQHDAFLVLPRHIYVGFDEYCTNRHFYATASDMPCGDASLHPRASIVVLAVMHPHLYMPDGQAFVSRGEFEWNFLTICDLSSDIVFILDIILCCFTAFVNLRGVVVVRMVRTLEHGADP